MPRNKAHEADSDTTVVNIADFQRTRDSPRPPLPRLKGYHIFTIHFGDLVHPFIRLLYPFPLTMKRGGYVSLSAEQLSTVVRNEKRSVEMIHMLTAHLSTVIGVMWSSSVDRHSLAKTYQKVIVALATLQNSVQDLSKAYINHANTVLNPGRAGVLDLNLTTTLLDSGLLAHRAPSPGTKQEPVQEAKKKRKRAAHDPNAPKRALTPYFLYMQSARPQIAQELGSNAKPKEVADEGTRRWSIMPEADKNVWNAAYQKNLAVYRIKTAAYKAGKPVPADEEADKIAQTDTTIAAVPVEEEEEEEEVEEEPEVVEEETASESSPEPVRAPSPPKTAKRRKTADRPAPTPVKETPPAAKPSPEKEKKTRRAKKESTPPPAAKAAERKKKSKKAA